MALLNPRRHAPRDIYDLSRLLENSDVHQPLEGLSAKQLQGMKSELWEKLDSFSWLEFKDQVVVQMDEHEAEGFNQDMFDQMQYAVGEGINTWLDEADKTLKPGDGHE